MTNHNKDNVKSLARGRCVEILSAICGVDPATLDGKHGPCPKCPDRGTDRFRAFKDVNDTGGLICNQCGKFADIFASVQWLNGCDFRESLRLVGEYVGATPQPTRKPVKVPPKEVSKRPKFPTLKMCAISHKNYMKRSGWSYVAHWMYHDKEGNAYAAVVRYQNAKGEKTYRQLAKVDGLWSARRSPTWEPYRANEITDADTIVIVGGEKAADAAWSVGIPATTSAMGEGNASKTNWAQLANKDVVISPDNDDAGEKYASDVAKLLVGIGCKVRVVRLPNIPVKGDMVEWLDTFGDAAEPETIREAFWKLANDASEWVDKSPAATTSLIIHESCWPVGTKVKAGDRDNIGTVVADHGATAIVHFVSPAGDTATKELSKSELKPLGGARDGKQPTFAGLDAAELSVYASHKTDWIVRDVIGADQPTVFGARSKCCKTTMLIDLAVAIASGTDWLGSFEIPRKRNILFVTGESTQRAAAVRLKRACESRDIELPDLKDRLRTEAVNFPQLLLEGDHEALAATIKEYAIDVVVVDPLYRGLSGIDTTRMAEVGPAIVKFTKSCQPASVIYSHHTTKAAARDMKTPPMLEDLSGAGVAESAGNWWLLARSTKYEFDGQHDLVVEYGGRDEQGGARRIQFDERQWAWSVSSMRDFIEEKQQEKDRQKREAEERIRSQDRAAIVKHMKNRKTPQSKSMIQQCCGVPKLRFGREWSDLTNDKSVEMRPYKDERNRTQKNGWIMREHLTEYDRAWEASQGGKTEAENPPTASASGDAA